MFICDNCGKNTEELELVNKVYVKREKTYKHVKKQFDKEKKKYVDVPYYTQGYETEKELNYCHDCAVKTGVKTHIRKKRIKRKNNTLELRG